MGSPRHRRDGVHGTRNGTRGARRDGRRRTGHHRVPSLALALLLLTFVPACAGRRDDARAAAPPAHVEENFTAIDSPALQFLPRLQEATGWKLERDPIVVPAARLGSYLDRQGAQFVAYSVIDLTAGHYTSTTGDGFATVEIFRFPDFVKAFGAYSLGKKGPIQFTNLENEAFVAKHSVHVWRGPFYIRVTGSGPEGNPSLIRLASSVAERMPAAPAKPAALNFLPVVNRVANSETYSATGALGQPFLGNAFEATFNVGGAIVEGLIIPAPSPVAAGRILELYRDLYIRNGKLLDPVPNLGEDNFTGEDKYLGRTVAFRIDRFVVAFNSFDERQKLIELAIAADQRILGTIRKQLVNADEQPRGKPETTATVPWTQRR